MEYAISNSTSNFSQRESLIDLAGFDKIKEIAGSFVGTLAFGQKDSFKSQIYGEYVKLIRENERLQQEVKILRTKNSMVENLVQFIDCLSLELEEPIVSGSVDKDLSLEWLNSDGEELVLTFKGNGKIIFSGILKDGTVSGVGLFKNKEIPNNIKPYISIFDTSR